MHAVVGIAAIGAIFGNHPMGIKHVRVSAQDHKIFARVARVGPKLGLGRRLVFHALLSVAKKLGARHDDARPSF